MTKPTSLDSEEHEKIGDFGIHTLPPLHRNPLQPITEKRQDNMANKN